MVTGTFGVGEVLLAPEYPLLLLSFLSRLLQMDIYTALPPNIGKFSRRTLAASSKCLLHKLFNGSSKY